MAGSGAKPLKVTLNGESHVFDMESLDLADWFTIKAASGYGMVSFGKGLADGDPLAMQVLVWWVTGRNAPLASINFRPLDLDIEPVDEPESPDPTQTTSSDVTGTPT